MLAASVSEASRSRKLGRRTIWSHWMATSSSQITSPVRNFKTRWRSGSSSVYAEALREARRVLKQQPPLSTNRDQTTGRPTTALCPPKTKVMEASSGMMKTKDSNPPGPGHNSLSATHATYSLLMQDNRIRISLTLMRNKSTKMKRQSLTSSNKM